eukprot:6212518-Pleurochrysis_carterae.AAC.2
MFKRATIVSIIYALASVLQFEAALHNIQDKYASLYDHLFGTDSGASPAHPNPGATPAGTCSQATTPAWDKYVRSKGAYNLGFKKFGLIRKHVTHPAILQEINTTTIGDGRAAWAILQGHVEPPHTGLTSIDDDSKWSLLYLSNVGIDKRTIIKIVAKINQLNLECKSTRQYNENKCRLKFLSLITFPAHLTAKVQEELQRPCYKISNILLLPLTVKAFDYLWRHAFRNNMI